MMRKLIIAVIIIMLVGLLIPCSAQMGEAGQTEKVRLRLDLEPGDCGTVYAEPPGENYTYAPGTMTQIYAKPAEGCRFAYWASDLAGLNGSINNPVTVTLFSDAYFKAVFVKIGAAKPGESEGGTHVFLRVTANVTNFQEWVKLVPVGEEVMVSVPRDIYLNDSARYVFVGWEGYESKEPTIVITVMNDTTVVALYTLYLRFMDLWYHYTDFTVFHAPIVELGPGARLKPLYLLLRPMNMTLPVGSKIPRELADRIEVKYWKEYLLTIESTAPGAVLISLNGEPLILESATQKWVPERANITLKVLTKETERGWITGPGQLFFTMDGPRSIMIEYEEKPYAWALDSPLKPVIYPVLDSVVRRFRDASLWPQVSRIVSQPILVYAMLAAIPAGIGGMGYAGYRLLSGMEGLRAGRARRMIEERIRRARPEEIISAIPSGFTPSASHEEERLPDRAPFPEWLHIEVPEHVEAGEPTSVERVEPVEDVKEPEEARRIDLVDVLSGGEIAADELIGALMGRLDEGAFEALRNAILSGSANITAAGGAVWSPVGVRAVALTLDEKRAVAIEGADMYVRRRVAEWVGLIEQESTGRPCVIIEDAYEKDAEGAAARIGKASLVILGENVKPDTVRIYSYAVGLLGRRLIKLGKGPLPTIRLKHPSEEELAAYMIVKAAFMGLMDRISLKDALEVAGIASMSRSYMTIDDYLGELSSGPVDLEKFKKEESERLFDKFERPAIAVWRRTGNVDEAIIHYGNILAQLDPANMDVKLRIFREKLMKIVGRPRKPPRQQNPRPVDDVGSKPADSKDRLAERYEAIIRNLRDEELRRKLMKRLETLRGERREED